MLGGWVIVPTTEIQSSDIVLLSRGTLSGATGTLSAVSFSAGVSFLINSSSSADNGIVFWEIVH